MKNAILWDVVLTRATWHNISEDCIPHTISSVGKEILMKLDGVNYG
jgi:hypothetical protein